MDTGWALYIAKQMALPGARVGSPRSSSDIIANGVSKFYKKGNFSPKEVVVTRGDFFF